MQEALANYRAQISTESSAISAKYDTLVSRTRMIAGKAMHAAWKVPPLDNDAGMNLEHIDYSGLAEPEREYLAAVKKDVTFAMIASAGLRSLLSGGKST